MSFRDIEQATAFGDLRIAHRADDGDVRASLDRIVAGLDGKNTRILRVIAPDNGELGLDRLIIQLADYPMSATEEVPTGTDVERAHLRLTRLDGASAQVLLLIEGADYLQSAALRYLQQVCADTPQLRLGLVWAAPPDMLSDAEFAPLKIRPVTELCFKGSQPTDFMPDGLPVNLISAGMIPVDIVLSASRLASTVLPDTIDVEGKPADMMPADKVPADITVSDATSADTWEPPRPPAWLIAGELPPSATRPSRAGRISIALVGLVAIAGIGIGIWVLRDRGIEVAAGMMAETDRAVTPTPAERIAVAEAPKASEPKKAEPKKADRVAESRLEATRVETAAPKAGPKPVAVADPPAVAYIAAVPQTRPAPVEAVRAEAAGPPPIAAATKTATEKIIPLAAEATPAVVADPPRPAPAILAAAIPAPAIFAPTLPAPVIAVPAGPPTDPGQAEISRADRLLETGDVSGARRWYEYAAARGSAIAATLLGRTYDPIVLARLHRPGGVIGEPAKARLWYEKAVAMGDPNATAALASLDAGH